MPFLYPVAVFWPAWSNPKADATTSSQLRPQRLSKAPSQVDKSANYSTITSAGYSVNTSTKDRTQSDLSRNTTQPTDPDPYMDRLIGIYNLTTTISDWEFALAKVEALRTTTTSTPGTQIIEYLTKKLGPAPTRELERVREKKIEFERMGRVEVAAQLAVLVWRVEDLLGRLEGLRGK
ncbi:uncharacterized protein BDZ99DRAFT_466618 [Mytilinidion resinicola]|uniref:Uncharacterized protein n=1 Tax=Mytilinidion resinicola TaxID=574789 RepID=A0A6A6YAE8_9PEZI|nr:uncharacterized protein BDZ99DRAFT_466618 [Mytilinidion resinicola]KAF2805670.1 hypothetical protein BDZ99DRAFT_466618 [Mytilinidion resinicola]